MSETTNQEPIDGDPPAAEVEGIDPPCQCGHPKSKHNCGHWNHCSEYCDCENFREDLTSVVDGIRTDLATAKADNERWSKLYAKQADELVAVKGEIATLKHQRDVFEASLREQNTYCEELKEAYCQRAHSQLVDRINFLEEAHGMAPEMSLLLIKDQKQEIATLKAKLAEVEGEKEIDVTGPLLCRIEEARQRAEAAEQRVKELAECLKWIAAEVPRPGLYHGGETYYALNQRIAQRAKDALSS